MSYHSNSASSQVRFATRAPSIISSTSDVLAEEYGVEALTEGGCPTEVLPVALSDDEHAPSQGLSAVLDQDVINAPVEHDGAGAALTFDLDIDFDAMPGTSSPTPVFFEAPASSMDAPTGQEGEGDEENEVRVPDLHPISLSSNQDHAGASKFAQAIARYRSQGFDFFQIAGKLMLSVLRKKEALLPELSEIDGSWQASVAWIADMIQEEETRDPIIDALFLLMDGERIKGRPDLIARHDEILAACARIRASGRHRRDQVIMRLGSVRDEVGVVAEKHSGAARLCVPIVMHSEEKETAEPCLFVAHPMTGFQRKLKKTLLAMGDFGRNKITWHQTERIEALFRHLQEAVLADERIQEVVFYWQTEGERRIALAFMNILSTLWNVPAFGRGEMDFLYMESARVAAIRMAKM